VFADYLWLCSRWNFCNRSTMRKNIPQSMMCYFFLRHGVHSFYLVYLVKPRSTRDLIWTALMQHKLPLTEIKFKFELGSSLIDVGETRPETVSGCFSVLFQFYFRDVRKPEIKQNFVSFQPTTGSILFNCSFISGVRRSLKQNNETVLGLFQPY